MFSVQRFETLAEQKYTSSAANLRSAAEAELQKGTNIENNSAGKVCELLYNIIEQSNSPFAHLETVNIIKSIWEKGKLTESQEQQFATVTIRTILNRYFNLPQQSQVFLKELIPFTLFSHPSSWASKVIADILKPFTVSYQQEIINAASGMQQQQQQQQVPLKTFPKAAEVVLINALIDIPKNMNVNSQDMLLEGMSSGMADGSTNISIRKSILRVLKFVKTALLLGYGVVSLQSLDPEQMKTLGIERGSLDALCTLLFTCVKVGKRFAYGSDHGYGSMKRSLKNKLIIYSLSGYTLSNTYNEDALVDAFYSTSLDDDNDSDSISVYHNVLDDGTIIENNGLNNDEDLGFNDNVYNGSPPSAPNMMNQNSNMGSNTSSLKFPSLLELSSHYISLYITHLMKVRDNTCIEPLTALAKSLSKMARRANNIPQEVVNTYVLIANRAFETMLGYQPLAQAQMNPSINYPVQQFNPTQNNESFVMFINLAHEAAHELFMMTKNVFGVLTNSSNNCDISSLNTQLIILLVFRMTELIHLLVMNEGLLNMWQSGMTAYATLIKCLCELTRIGKRKIRKYKIRSNDIMEENTDGNGEDEIPDSLFPPGSTNLQKVSMIFDTAPNSQTTCFRCVNSQVQFPADLSGAVPLNWIKKAVIVSASYTIGLFTSQYGRYINVLYTQAERQGDATFTLPSVNKDGIIDNGSGSDKHIEESARSPLIEDCCPSDFWYILRILPIEELLSFTVQAEPMIQMLIELGPRSTPEGLTAAPFNQQEYTDIVGTTVNLAWMMAIVSVALVLDVPLTTDYRVRTLHVILMSINAAEVARRILGFNSPTIKYLETTIISSLRGTVTHHLTNSYSDIEFYREIGAKLGIDDENNTENGFNSGEEVAESGFRFRNRIRIKQSRYSTKVLNKIYSIIIAKLLVNIQTYQQSSLQSHSVKLLHQIVRQLPQPTEYNPMIDDVMQLLKTGPLHILDSIIIDPTPVGRAVRLGKGLSGVIASILRNLREANTSTGITSHMGLDTIIVNMLIEYYDVIAKYAFDGSNATELIKAFVSLRGFLPALLRTSEYAFIIVKMFILYCPALDAVVENSLKNSTSTNNYVGFLIIVKFILKMFISVLKSGIGDLVETLRSNGNISSDKSVNTLAYSSPYLHVSSILCSFVTAIVTTQGKINAALKILSERAASSPIVNPLTLSACICCSCNMVDLLMSNPQGANSNSYRTDAPFSLDMMVNEDLLYPYLSGTLSLVPILHSLVGRDSGMSRANSEIINRKKYLHTTIVTAADILSRFPFILLGNANLDKNLVGFLYKESCALIGMRAFNIGISSNSTVPQESNDNLSLTVGLRSLLPLVTTALHCRRSFNSMNNLNQMTEDPTEIKMNLGNSGHISPQMFVFIKDCCALKPDICNSTQEFINGISSLIPPLSLVFKHVLMILLDKVSSTNDGSEGATITILGALLLLSIYKFYNKNDRSNLWNVVSLGISSWAGKEERSSNLLDSLKSTFDSISEEFRIKEADIQIVKDEIFSISRKIHRE